MNHTLISISREIRIDLAKMFYISQTGHFAPALSCVDILTELYFGDIVNYDARFTDERDRVILSKGHACAALYVVLAKAGYFSREKLKTFYKYNSLLGGHPNINLPGIETATGALGHGICFATGTAKAAKIDGKNYRTYVIIGDGESQEGSVWEAAEFAANEHLNNLIVIMDYNGLQASASLDDIMPISPIIDKWRAFGWYTEEINGHNFDELHRALTAAKNRSNRPTVIVAKTIKGKGISIAENNPAWHSRSPKNEEWDLVCRELGISREELGML